MGQLHLSQRKVTLAEAVSQYWVALVRAADPPTGQHSDFVRTYRYQVIDWLKGSGPALLELRTPREGVERAMRRNPNSHPIQEVYLLDGAIQLGSAEDQLAEFILFVHPQPMTFALGGLRLPASKKAEILALVPPPPKRGFWARLFGKK